MSLPSPSKRFPSARALRGVPTPRDAARRVARRLRSTPPELAALLALAAVLAVAWAVVVPPLQGPDEFTHANYAQQIAERGQGPYFDRGERNLSTEIGAALHEFNLQPLIGVVSARAPSGDLVEQRWSERQAGFTDAQRADGTGPSPLARSPQLYYVYAAVPYTALGGGDLFDRMMAMRLAGGVLFVLTVLLTWLLAVEAFGRAARLRATVAATVAALWPMLAFMGSVVSPDIALAAAYTLVALLAVRLVRRGPTLGRVLALALGGATAMLVHGRGLAAVVVVAVAVAVAWLCHRPPLRLVVAWSAAGAALAAVPLALSRVLLPSSTAGGLYGGEANFPQGAFNVREFIVHTWQFYFDRLAFMEPRRGPDFGYRQVVVERFVAGVFGSLEVTFPAWVYDVTQLGVIGLLIVLWTALVVHRARVVRRWPTIAVLATLAVALMLLLHAASYRALLGADDPLITGRYLLPLVPLIALACGWLVTAFPRAVRGPAAAGLVSVMLLLQLGALGITVLRFHV